MARKPCATATNHLLPFGELSPFDFERMVLWLVGEEGFENPQHTGACGGDGGRDVIATRPGITESCQTWYFQCKRYSQAPSRKVLSNDLTSITDLDTFALSLSVVVFVSSCKISARTRDSLVKQGLERQVAVIFWAHSELDRLVKKWPLILGEFFNLSPTAAKKKRVQMSRSVNFFLNRTHELDSLEKSFEAGRVVAVVGLPGMGKSALVAHFVGKSRTRHSFWLDLSSRQPVEVIGTQLLDFLCLVDPDNAKYRGMLNERTPAHIGLLLGELLAREPCVIVFDDLSVSNAAYHREFFLSLFSAVQSSRIVLCCTSKRAIAALDSSTVIDTIGLGGLPASHASKVLLKAAPEGRSESSPELIELAESVGGNPYLLRRLGRMLTTHSASELLRKSLPTSELVTAYIGSFLRSTFTAQELDLLGSLSLIDGTFSPDLAELLGDKNRRILGILIENIAIEEVAEGVLRVHSLLRFEAQPNCRDPVAAHTSIARHYETFISALEIESLKAVHHYLEAGNENAARLVCDRIFGYCLFKAQFRLVLSWAELVQSDDRTTNWPELHYVRGRALRFLGLRDEALQAYKDCEVRATGELRDIVLLEGVSVAISGQPLSEFESSSIDRFEETLQTAAESKNIVLRQGALGALVYLYNNTGRPELGLDLARRSLQESIDSKDSRLEMQGRIKLGLTLFHSFHDYENAISELTLGLEILSKRGYSGQDFDAEINAVRALVRCFMEIADYEAAIGPARRWKALAERRDGAPYELVDALLRSGQIHCLLGLFEEAVEELLKAEKLLSGMDEPNMTLFMLEWLADSLWNIGRLEECIERILEGAKFADQRGIRWGKHAIASASLFGDMTALEKARKEGFHILLMPKDLESSIIEDSHKAIWIRRPDLRGISLMGFEREQEE
jgi:tetratricopeptide (TPR) repeat protein